VCHLDPALRGAGLAAGEHRVAPPPLLLAAVPHDRPAYPAGEDDDDPPPLVGANQPVQSFTPAIMTRSADPLTSARVSWTSMTRPNPASCMARTSSGLV